MVDNNDSGGGKRRHKRVELFSKVKVRAGGSEQEVLAGNVSAGGIFLRSNRPLEPGQQVSLEIDMGGTPVTVDVGEVRWARPFEPVSVDGSIPGMGVEFKQMSEEARRRIESFIEEALAGEQQADNGTGQERQQPETKAQGEPAGSSETGVTNEPGAAPEPAVMKIPIKHPDLQAEQESALPGTNSPPAGSTEFRANDGRSEEPDMTPLTTPPAPRSRAVVLVLFVLAVAAATFAIMSVLMPTAEKGTEPRPPKAAKATGEQLEQPAGRGERAPATKQPVPAASPEAKKGGERSAEKSPAVQKPADQPATTAPAAAGEKPGPGTRAEEKTAGAGTKKTKDSSGMAAATPATRAGKPRFARTDGGWQMVIDLDGKAEFKKFTLKSPPRLAIDLKSVVYTGRAKTIKNPADFVSRVRIGPHPDYVRFVLDFVGEKVPRFRIFQSGNRLVVNFPR